MRVVGLTGGIASGKSTVSTMFRERGAPIVDADVVAREIVAPGSPALDEIVARFGEQVLDAQGQLDRKVLGKIVFSDGIALAALGQITHPRIAAESRRRLAEISQRGQQVALYEAALIVENQLHLGMDGLIVVSIPLEQQIQRLMHRDGIDRDAAENRVGAQLPLADKVAVADHVIDNSGTLEETEARVAAIWAAIRGISDEQ